MSWVKRTTDILSKCLGYHCLCCHGWLLGLKGGEGNEFGSYMGYVDESPTPPAILWMGVVPGYHATEEGKVATYCRGLFCAQVLKYGSGARLSFL